MSCKRPNKCKRKQRKDDEEVSSRHLRRRVESEYKEIFDQVFSGSTCNSEY